MPLVVIASERFAEHQTPPGHPESPERAAVMDAVVQAWRLQGGEVVAPRAATAEQLARVHDAAYLRRLAAVAGQAVALDPDTYTSPETIDVAALAAGAAVDAVERVMDSLEPLRPFDSAQGRPERAEGRSAKTMTLSESAGSRATARSKNPDAKRALAVVRPPGHHAERGRAMGFCFYNNIAVAAAHARSLGAGNVAIVDYDVHHGNGTQHMFEDDPHVLYVSTHQFPYYPGTGAAEEIGHGPGKGFTVNIPLEVGAVDEDYHFVFTEVVLPVLRQFKPDLLLLSAGFDAHERDPIAGMRLTTEAFAAITLELRRVAEECGQGRIVAVTEGGYDLRALADSLHAVVRALAVEDTAAASWPAPGAVPPSRGRAAVARTKAALAHHWKL